MQTPINKFQQLMIITMEECGELVQACSKVYRHGNKKEDRKTAIGSKIT